jgi:hypothetical protein
VLLSRSAISSESLSGDEDLSGDSGDDRGGVSSRAASTHRTRFDGLDKGWKVISKNIFGILSQVYLTCNHWLAAHSHQSIRCSCH